MSTAVTNDEIADRLAKHDARMTTIAETVNRIEKELEPIVEVYADIAAVGRVGRKIGNVIKWFGGVSLACAAMWAAIKGYRPW